MFTRVSFDTANKLYLNTDKKTFARNLAFRWKAHKSYEELEKFTSFVKVSFQDIGYAKGWVKLKKVTTLSCFILPEAACAGLKALVHIIHGVSGSVIHPSLVIKKTPAIIFKEPELFDCDAVDDILDKVVSEKFLSKEEVDLLSSSNPEWKKVKPILNKINKKSKISEEEKKLLSREFFKLSNK